MIFYRRQAKLTVYAESGSSGTAVDLSRFQFEFQTSSSLPVKVDGKIQSDPRKIEVLVYRLPDDLRSELSANAKGVELEFGYDGELSSLFRGPVVNVTSHKNGVDWVTHIDGSVAWDVLSVTRYGRSFRANTPVTTIITDVAKSLGLPVIMKATITASLLTGTVFEGLTKVVLDKLARDYDLAWEVKPEGIEITDTLNPPLVDMSRIVVLGPELLSAPVVEESAEKKKNKEIVSQRVHAVSLLHPAVLAGVPIRFKTPSFLMSSSDVATRKLKDFDSGAVFRCESVTHRGNNFGGECSSDILTSEVK